MVVPDNSDPRMVQVFAKYACDEGTMAMPAIKCQRNDVAQDGGWKIGCEHWKGKSNYTFVIDDGQFDDLVDGVTGSMMPTPLQPVAPGVPRAAAGAPATPSTRAHESK